MWHVFCLLLIMFIVSGCDTVRYFSADRSDKEKREQLEKERLDWQIKYAETQYRAGEIDRATYNRIRRQHGLAPAN
jgi:uncharacterized membrane protein